MNSTESNLHEMISKAAQFKRIENSEAYVFSDIREEILDDLAHTATAIRDEFKGKKISFSPKVFIPLTRMCRDFCGYCTFRADPSELDQLYMTPEEILSIVKKAESLGCTEALFTLGERPELKYEEAKKWLNAQGFQTTLEYLAVMTQMVINKSNLFPHANPGTMSRREMENLKSSNPSMGLMLESTSEELYKSGGPHEFAPSKRPLARLKTIETAGELKIPFTTGLLIGIGETQRDRIDSLLAIREMNEKYGHIQEVIIQNFRAKPQTPMQDFPDAISLEMMWTVAVSRLILGPEINIQVPPNLSISNFEQYINVGIYDWGGISPLTIDYVNPEAPWPLIKELKNKTEFQGYELTPRLPVYPEFFINNESFLSDTMGSQLKAMSDELGYVKWGIDRYE